MKNPSSTIYSLAALLLVASPPTVLSQTGTDTLMSAPGFMPTLSLIESITDSIETTREPGADGEPDLIMRDVVTMEKSTVKITANITGINLANIGPTTTFNISVGKMKVSGSLSDDPTYTPVKRSIFIPAKTNPDTGKVIGSNGIRLAWTATRLTASITRASEDDVDPGAAAAQNFVGNSEPEESISFKSEVPVSVAFAELTSNPRLAFIQGKTSVKVKTYGSEEDGDFEEHTLNAVSLSGAFDNSLPSVSITAPTNNSNQTGAFTLTGKAGDGHGVDSVEISNTPESPMSWSKISDPLTNLPPVLPEGVTWGTTNKQWTLSVLPLPYGTTRFWVRSVDTSGNRSTPIVFSFVNPMPSLLTGRWDGLISPTSGKHGYLTFNCDIKGALTGKLTVEGTSRPISFVGTWSGQNISATIKRTIGNPLLLSGVVNSLSPASTAAAVINFTLEELPAISAGQKQAFGSGTTFRCPYSTANRLPNIAPTISPALGRFNVSIAPGNAASSPSGCGYFSMVVTDTGAVTVSGRMADGSSVLMSSVLGADGQVPIYVPLYTSKGCFNVLEKIDLLNGAVSASALSLWRRPAAHTDKQFPSGFDVELATQGQRYTAPPTNTRVMSLIAATPNASAEWEGDAIPSLQTQPLEVSHKNAVLAVGGNSAFSAKITSTTGIISGSLRLPSTTTSASWFALIVGNSAQGHYIAPPVSKTTRNRFGKLSLSGKVPTFEGGDDFNNNLKDLDKWRSTDIAYGGGVLKEINGRLEFTTRGAVAETQVVRPWTRNFGSLTKEFEAIVDVHNEISPPSPTNTQAAQPNASMGIILYNSADRKDYIYLELYRGSDGYYFLTSLVVDDNGDLPNDVSAPQASFDGSLRLLYNPATQVVTAYYDVDGAANGYSWRQLASYGINGTGGSTANASWSLAGNPVLGVSISTFAEKMTLASGKVYVDNFQVKNIAR